MKNGLVIADAGPIFSLAVIDKLELLNQLFDEIKISKAVWEEITLDKSTEFYNKLELFFRPKVTSIKGFNELTFVMDYGESESVILYKELKPIFISFLENNRYYSIKILNKLLEKHNELKIKYKA